MAYESPLRERHATYQQPRRPDPALRPGAATGFQRTAPEVQYLSWGSADPGREPTCQIVSTFGDLESEYAAIRTGAGLLESPNRGTICVEGADRCEFLDRMLTQQVKDLGPGQARPAFLLNRKGRIEADLLLIETGERLLIDVDVHRATPTVQMLERFLFLEDVRIEEASGQWHHLAIHGPRAADVITAAAGIDSFELEPMASATLQIAGVASVVVRRDQTGEMGLQLICPLDQVETIWERLIATDESIGGSRRRVRPIGWHAFNVARIEAGTPLFHLDFGSDSLPHETGVLDDRVSFTKGCYLGQEIVARTQSRGRPRQRLVGVRMATDHLPIAGAEVYQASGEPSTPVEDLPAIGVITSSTLSPMLGAAPIAFGRIKTDCATEGAALLVAAEGEQAQATVSGLRFWAPTSASGPRGGPPERA
ncbi:MAG: aminomethyl transferase family protein [Planctomycetes bacterium]|nr:aminomethyl transferase family protein [Planctomycetota bacterium]